MRRFITILVVVLLVGGVLAAAGCAKSDVSSSTVTSLPPARPVLGNPAPDFELKALDGQAVSLSGLKGRPVLLNFWATWCPPCKEEIGYLQDLSTDVAWTERGLEMVAVDIQEAQETVQQFGEDFGITYRVLLDPAGHVAELYNIKGIPTTYFIDGDGIIRYIKSGAFTGKNEIETILENSIIKD